MVNMWNLICTAVIIYNKFAIAAVPGAVQNIRVESEFPDTPFRVSFDKPAVGDASTFLKYRITIEPQFGASIKPCIIRWIVVCDKCTGTVTDSSTKTCSSAVTKDNAATYKSTDSSYSFIFNNTEFKPSQFYKVFIEAGNADGWGKEVSQNVASGQYKSSKVRNLITSYNSSNDMLNIKWTVPVDQQGKVQRYQMWIVDASSNKCLLSRKITCGDCSVLELGKKDVQDLSICTNKLDNLRYNEVQDQFEVDIESYCKNSLQLGFSDRNLTLNMVAVNKYGWGNVTSTRVVGCKAKKSSKVRNLITSYNSSNDISNIKWTVPENQNGKVHQYQMWIVDKSLNKCLLSKTITCGDCTDLELGKKDVQNLTTCTNKLDNLTYKEVQDQFEVDLESYCKNSLQFGFSDRNLTLNMVAVNKFGWGNVTSTRVVGCKSETNKTCCQQLNVTLSQSNRETTVIKFDLINQTAYCNVKQYNVWITDGFNKCFWWTNLICGNCTSDLPQPGQPDLSKCHIVNTKQFSLDSNTVTVETKISLFPKLRAMVSPVLSSEICNATITKSAVRSMVPSGGTFLVVFAVHFVISTWY